MIDHTHDLNEEDEIADRDADRDQMKLEQAFPGQWIQPVRKNYKLCCCDCGLVHRLDFRLHKRRIQFRAYRDNRSTGQVRRHMDADKRRDADSSA